LFWPELYQKEAIADWLEEVIDDENQVVVEKH
jgi:hypothetical protein